MILGSVCPEALPSPTLDRSGHLVQLAIDGYTQLAADTILNREICGRLQEVVGNAIRQFNLLFVEDETIRERCYEALVEIAFDLIGIESKAVGFSQKEIDSTLGNIVQALKRWENIERELGEPAAARTVIKMTLQNMKQILMGESMVAKMAEEIENSLDEDNLMESLVQALKQVIRKNVYYVMVIRGMTKIGNDSATGLRRMRHLGAVQVSSNPVIAARAYVEFPELWEEFREIVKDHAVWSKRTLEQGDEIAMYATIVSLLPNLLVFRPVALLSDFHDGLVSIQLNPENAGDLKSSIRDAMKIYSILGEILKDYDAHLMCRTDVEGRGRPNVVFKVAVSSPVAIEITIALNRRGIGTNNTVTYTATQEVRLILAAMKGLSDAVRMGIPITQVYETNMIGRLNDHLRESEGERLLHDYLRRRKNGEALLEKLAREMAAWDAVKDLPTQDEKISVLCLHKHLGSLRDDEFIETVKKISEKPSKIEEFLSQLEKDIQNAGVFVTRRVYRIFFTPENKKKWIRYLEKEYGVSRQEAEDIFDKIDLLASSKRIAEHTYLVLAGGDPSNLTNTEFPNHQLRVLEMSRQNDFNLSDYENSIKEDPDPGALERLLKIEDFRKAYELTPQLARKLKEVGIRGEFGEEGVQPKQWPSYGPVVKTMREFKSAYANFKTQTTDFVKKLTSETGKK